jgi:hypothetical protein
MLGVAGEHASCVGIAAPEGVQWLQTACGVNLLLGQYGFMATAAAGMLCDGRAMQDAGQRR